ncbi:MAG: TonB-dependent receptor [Polyangiales bacterium]
MRRISTASSCLRVASWFWAAVALTSVASLDSVVSAQIGTGTLTGRVVDASSHKPLGDVVVTATSPGLQGEQTVVTDDTGTFRIPSLPPGTYELRYEADTFRPYRRDTIELRASVTLRVDAELLPETLKADEVTVIARPPTVDVGTARSGVTLDQDFTSRVPVAPPSGKGGGARSFEQLAEVAPTAHSDEYGQSIAGTTSPENQYMVDGISTGDPGFGYNAVPLSIDFIKEASIITGGYLPEYGRGGGGVLDVVTKSGSNEFHGTFFGNVTPWQARPTVPLAQDAINATRRLRSTSDIGFDIGGPLIKDKLWFYIGADIAKQTFTLDRYVNLLEVAGPDGKYLRNDAGLVISTPIPGTARAFAAEMTQYQYLGKLTWSPGQNDRVELVHRGTPSRSGGDGNYSIDYATGLPVILASSRPQSLRISGNYGTTAWRQVMDSYDTSLKWTHSALNKRLTFDTIAGWHNQRSADLAADGSEFGTSQGLSGTRLFPYRRTSPVHPITDFETIPNPSLCINPVMDGDARCPVATYSVGGPQILRDSYLNRYQLRELITLVAEGLGHHIIKAGAELEYLTYDSAKSYPGGAVVRESTSGANVTDYRRYAGLTAPDEGYTINPLSYKTTSLSVGAFVQDSWSIMDKVTLNAGFRYDSQMLYGDDGKLGLSLPNQWSPRLGVIFDPTQQGRAKLFANYAIYYQSIPLNIMDRAGSGEPQAVIGRPIAGCNPTNSNWQQTCDNPANRNVLGDVYNPNQYWAYQSSGKLAIDPDLKPPSSSEFSAGGEYEIIPNGRLGVTYIRRWTNNVLEDMSRDAQGNVFFLGNPGSGIASDFPTATRTYDAGIVHFTKTFADKWLAQASYTLSHLRGNWEGLFRAQTGQLDPGTNADFDIRSLTINRTGDLDADRRHEVKLFAARDFIPDPQHHVNLGLSYRATSGGPTNVLGAHPRYGNDEIFLLPRGAGDRLPWVHTFDVHVGYTFLQTKAQTLAVTADIFNLFNFQAVTQRSNRYTLREVEPITGPAADNPYSDGDSKRINPSIINPSDGGMPFTDSDRFLAFGSPLSYQTPFTVRFGVKGTF